MWWTQNRTLIIQIWEKNQQITLQERSLMPFSGCCKDCNMLDVWIIFSLFLPAQLLLFFWTIFSFSVALRSAPLRPVTTFYLQIYAVLKLRAKSPLASENVCSNAVVFDPSFSPSLGFSASIIYTYSVSCHVCRIILLPDCKIALVLTSVTSVIWLLLFSFFAVLNYIQNIEKLLRPSSIPSKLLHLLPSLTASPLAKSRPTQRWRGKAHLHFRPLTESKVLRIYVPNLPKNTRFMETVLLLQTVVLFQSNCEYFGVKTSPDV